MNTNPLHHNIFSDKFRIYVVDLTQIEHATEEDKKYLRETSNAMYELDQDRPIRQQCQAREDFLYRERIKENRNQRIKTELAETKAELADKDAELAAKDALIAELLARYGKDN